MDLVLLILSGEHENINYFIIIFNINDVNVINVKTTLRIVQKFWVFDWLLMMKQTPSILDFIRRKWKWQKYSILLFAVLLIIYVNGQHKLRRAQKTSNLQTEKKLCNIHCRLKTRQTVYRDHIDYRNSGARWKSSKRIVEKKKSWFFFLSHISP